MRITETQLRKMIKEQLSTQPQKVRMLKTVRDRHGYGAAEKGKIYDVIEVDDVQVTLYVPSKQKKGHEYFHAGEDVPKEFVVNRENVEFV